MAQLDHDYLWLHDRSHSSTARFRMVFAVFTALVFLVALWQTVSLLHDQTTMAPAGDSMSGDRAADGPAQRIATRRPVESPTADSHDSPRGAATPSGHRWRRVRIHADDTLSIAFNRAGLSYVDSIKIAHMPRYGAYFTRELDPGDVLRVRAGDDGVVDSVDMNLDELHTLFVRRRDNRFIGRVVMLDADHRRAVAVGAVNHNFYSDAIAAGLSDPQVLRVNELFAPAIDFATDIRPGDRFVVIYDELYRDGHKLANGDILAAAFVNQGQVYQALRFVTENGESAYYTAGGKPVEKAFRRAPVDYTRISSRFSPARNHPILHRIRRHAGTDFAAPTGTPIRATGRGRIVFRGRRGGYGNMVAIRHDAHITTRYGHMSRFARGLRTGSPVAEGQVIGYVGMTGLATGPHVHYEFRVDGRAENPQTVELPGAPSLTHDDRTRFRRRTATLAAELTALTRNIARTATVARAP